MYKDELKLVNDLLYNPYFKDHFIDSIFKITIQEKEEILKIIENIKLDNFKTTKEKGNALEFLMKKIFKAENIFKVYQNVHTSSNEIDLVIQIQSNGLIFNLNTVLGIQGDKILVECKNYKKKIDVTWVGKFAHLLNHHDIDYGIIFSKYSLTGIKKGKLTWNQAAGLVKKFYLKHSKSIINITLDEIKDIISEDKSFVEFLKNKKNNIQLDTNIELIPHENSDVDFLREN